MNTAGYLILIAALLIVAGLLLYARFVSRARENSLHHSPGDPVSAAEPSGVSAVAHDSVSADDTSAVNLSSAGESGVGYSPPVAENRSGDAGGRECREMAETENPEMHEDGGKAAENSPDSIGEPVAASAGEAETPDPVEEPVAEVLALRRHDSRIGGDDSDEERKGEYLDELQEAAAGLAMLMRSSPVANRSNPVVFAPDDSEEEPVVDQEADRQDPVEERVLMKVSLPENDALESEETRLSPDGGEATEAREEEAGDPDGIVSDSASETVAAESEAEHPVGEVQAPGADGLLLQLLGPEVSEQFAEIDSGLDMLEDLVDSIEASLRTLAFEGEADPAAAEEEVVSRAA